MRKTYVKVNIEGRNTEFQGGPKSNLGKIHAKFYINIGSESVEVFEVLLIPHANSKKIDLRAYDLSGHKVYGETFIDE